MEQSLSVETLTPAHWPAVRSIYMQGMATGNATFQQSAPEWQEWNEAHLGPCRLVATVNGEAVGWAALSAISSRAVYSGVAEISIYVAEASRGHGVGKLLLAKLIADSEAAGLWTLQAGIFPENTESLRLHLSQGFRVVGTRSRLGKMNGRWRDVVLMERRSDRAGMDLL